MSIHFILFTDISLKLLLSLQIHSVGTSITVFISFASSTPVATSTVDFILGANASVTSTAHFILVSTYNHRFHVQSLFALQIILAAAPIEDFISFGVSVTNFISFSTCITYFTSVTTYTGDLIS